MTALPLAPAELETSAAVEVGAQWLATRSAAEPQLNVIAELQKRFGLTPLESVQALREANLRARALHE